MLRKPFFFTLYNFVGRSYFHLQFLNVDSYKLSLPKLINTFIALIIMIIVSYNVCYVFVRIYSAPVHVPDNHSIEDVVGDQQGN